MKVVPSFAVGLPAENEQVNPFLNRTAFSPVPWRELCKQSIIAFVLLPGRLLMIAAVIIMGFIVAKVSTLGLQDGQPLEGWRRALLEVIFTGRHMLLWAFGFFDIRVKGKPAPKTEAPILVANHVSGLIEGMFLLRCATMAEAHYIQNPVLGPIMKGTSAIAVDRQDPNSRHVAKESLLQRARDPRWPQTLVFPEGTCTNGNALVQFKLGAFAPGLPVQPVIFRYPSKAHDPSFTFPRTTLSYLKGMLLQFRNPMTVEYLPVYYPSESEKQCPARFAAGVQRKMAEALGVPATKHAAEDVSLCLAAQRLRLPFKTGMVQWQAITENLTQMRYREASQLLKEFRKMDTQGKGRLDFPSFAKAMRSLVREDSVGSKDSKDSSDSIVRGTEYSDEDLRSVFNLLDVSGDGYVDFREYLCGVAVLNGRGQTEEVASLKFVFECLANGEAHFTKEKLADLLYRAVPWLDEDRLEEYFAEAGCNEDGLVSRDGFIAFATKHREDLGLQARDLLPGFPEMSDKTL